MGHGGGDWGNITISILVLSSMDYPTDCCPHWSGTQRKGLHTPNKVGPEKVIHCGMRFSPNLGVPAPHPGLQGRKEFNVNSGSSIVVEQIISCRRTWCTRCLPHLSSNNLPCLCDSQFNNGINGAQWGGNDQLINDILNQVCLFPNIMFLLNKPYCLALQKFLNL